MTKRIFKSFLTPCALLLSVLGTVRGATYYVSTAGSDFNPGTQATPFRHVSRGASAARAGDTVIVMDGTYDNEGQVAQSNGSGSVVTVTNAGTPTSPIIFKAQNRGGAILDAANTSNNSGPYACNAAWAYFDVSYTSYVVIQGFVIEHGCFNAIHANGNAHDITVKWNEIRNIGNWSSGGATLSSTGIYLNHNEYNFIFDGNIFHDIGGGTIVNQEHAIYTSASNVTICNNVFYNQVHGWDIQTAGGKNLFISNNTFAFPNPNRDGHIILWDQGITNSLSNIVIQNNIFYQPGSHAVVTELDGGGSISGCTNENNLTTAGSIYDNGSSCVLSNNITNTDPSFVNPLAHDFHLQSGSRAIDNGMISSVTQVDFDNWLRPVNSIYDRGSFEYHSASVASLILSASPASLALTPGRSVTSTIAAVAVGASPAFSASGLPSGVTATFAPASCPGSCTTKLTLTASSTAQGSTTVTVKGTSGSVTTTTAIALSISTTTPTLTGDYTSGLAAEWKLNGTAADSVNHNNGNLFGGATWSTSTYNGASFTNLLLNGSTAFVSVGESPSLEMTQNLTVSFWVNASAIPSTSAAKGDTDPRIVAKVYDWDVKLNGAVHPQFSAAGKYAAASYSVPLGVWTHVVFTYASGVVNAYVNGQPASLSANTFTGTGALPTGAYGLYIGTDSSITQFYAGKIADVRVYNRALKAADVLALYSAVTP